MSGELDLVILTKAFTHIDCVGEKKSRSPQSSFPLQGRQICKEMFLHVYGIRYARFLQLKKHWKHHGHSQRTTKRGPENATSLCGRRFLCFSSKLGGGK